MTEQELRDLLEPWMDPKYDGTFLGNEFDLDVDVENDWKTFHLFVGGPGSSEPGGGEVVKIDLPVTLENAELIQKGRAVIRAGTSAHLGHAIQHRSQGQGTSLEVE